MTCHFCLNPAQFRETRSPIEFCNQYCQIGYHVIHRIDGAHRSDGLNPLELKDTVFSILLQVPPSELFKMYDVSRRFRRILESDGSFKAAYIQKWEITDEFYLKAKYFYHEWMPYLSEYRGFLNRHGTRDEIFTAAVLNYRLDIVQLMLQHLQISPNTLQWCIRECVQRDHYTDIAFLQELFKYSRPTNIALEEAIANQREIEIVELILSYNTITDVEDPIRWAGFHGNEPVMILLLTYQEKLKEREGPLKRQKK